MSGHQKLYNVVVEVVDLVWADSPDEAKSILRSYLRGRGFDPLNDSGDRASVSEPVPELGWDGES